MKEEVRLLADCGASPGFIVFGRGMVIQGHGVSVMVIDFQHGRWVMYTKMVVTYQYGHRSCSSDPWVTGPGLLSGSESLIPLDGRNISQRPLANQTHCPFPELQTTKGATVAERLSCSPPTTEIRVQSPAGNRAGRCCWSAGFLGDLEFPPPFHSCAAPFSTQSRSSALKTSRLRAVQISSPTNSLEEPTCERLSGERDSKWGCSGQVDREILNGTAVASMLSGMKWRWENFNEERKRVGLIAKSATFPTCESPNEPAGRSNLVSLGVRRCSVGAVVSCLSGLCDSGITWYLVDVETDYLMEEHTVDSPPVALFTVLMLAVHRLHSRWSLSPPLAALLARRFTLPADSTGANCVTGRIPYACKERKSYKVTCIAAERDWAAITCDWGHDYLPERGSPEHYCIGRPPVARSISAPPGLRRGKLCVRIPAVRLLAPTTANRVQSPAEPLPDFQKWESCRTMPLVGGFSISPAHAFRFCIGGIDKSRRDLYFGAKISVLAHRSRKISCPEIFALSRNCRRSPRAPNQHIMRTRQSCRS
ncbi:hypothetical protein PR048_004448 [Dryococelus australis]|uniref:Uncharacterized protein n=1 Tax=Dryococelus australis TaxID=614101 RepID=A0ABQ9I5X7_9NEOP|nr:hypothetical protein PR048_004448 [Dryococelus australis]